VKVVFVYPATENLGIEYLSAYLKKAGHETELLFDPQPFNDLITHIPPLARLFNLENKIVDRAEEAGGDLIAFSVVTDNFGWSLRMAEKIKNRTGKPIVFGGIHPSAVAGEVLSYPFVDYVIRGEGEEAIADLADSLSNGSVNTEIKNLAYRKNGSVIYNPLRNLVQDLDDLPFPDKDFFYSAAHPAFRRAYHITTSRGCAYHCSFCFNSFQKKLYSNTGEGKMKYLRRRSIGNVIEELTAAHKKYGFKTVEFWDDIFTLHKSWVLEFLGEYSGNVGLPFACRVNPNAVDDSLIQALEKANCRVVHMGIQSFNETTGEYVLKRRQRNIKVEKVIEIFAKSGIYLYTDNMIGIPGQKEEEIADLIRFYNRHRVDFIKLLWLRYYPKIEIVEIAKNMGVLSDKELKRIDAGLDSKPFTQTCKGDNPDFNRLRNLGISLPLLPRRLVSFILERRRYRFIPGIDLYNYGAVACRIKGLLTFAKKPIPTYFSIWGYLRMIVDNIRTKIGYSLRLPGRRPADKNKIPRKVHGNQRP
jgi:radical SAM superfamily enzyme YgiQ (UPF0313 family)